MFRETINNYIIETMNLVIDKDMILFIIYYKLEIIKSLLLVWHEQIYKICIC